MLLIRRTAQNTEGTFGDLFLEDKRFGVTVERPAPPYDHPCIPAGIYHWIKFDSPHNGPCLLLQAIPGRDMIEMHSANFMLQLLGCIAPGRAFGRFTGVWESKHYDLQGVTHSKDTLLDLLELLPDDGTIEIVEDF